MATRYVCGISPTVPAEDVRTRPEGGAEAAKRAVKRLLPGRYALDAHGPATEYGFRVATHGPTVIIVGEAGEHVRTPEGYGTFRYAYQSTAMAAHFEVTSPTYGRRLVTAPGVVELDEGDRLPFDAPERTADDGRDTVDADALAAAALQWMFGFPAVTPDPAECLDPHAFHTFRPSDEDPPHREERPSRAGFTRRFFRRG